MQKIENIIRTITGCGGQASASAFDVGGELLRQDLYHRLGGQLVHRVVLVVAAGQVGELLPGQLVDALNHLKWFSTINKDDIEIFGKWFLGRFPFC